MYARGAWAAGAHCVSPTAIYTASRARQIPDMDMGRIYQETPIRGFRIARSLRRSRKCALKATYSLRGVVRAAPPPSSARPVGGGGGRNRLSTGEADRLSARKNRPTIRRSPPHWGLARPPCRRVEVEGDRRRRLPSIPVECVDV